MNSTVDVPSLIIVRTLTSGGPFLEHDYLSIAFTKPTIGRLASHAARECGVVPTPEAPSIVPETISVSVVHGAGPYACDDVLILSFVEPSFVRIHPAIYGNRHPPRNERTETTVAAVVEPTPKRAAISTTSSIYAEDGNGVRFSLSWSEDRVRRFVGVTDKLFTVDRLGWYRHAFAMRLLVPDEISCGDPGADAEAAGHLHALRSAVLETLGRPLIAAFMPTFRVTREWLDSLDSAESAKALIELCGAIAPFMTLPATRFRGNGDPATTYGRLSQRELMSAPTSSVESLLPLLIANVSAFDDVTERLTSYRRGLIDLFGGTAQCVETVRLGQMTQPNHTLDDGLWQLAGTISQRFGGLAVA